MVEILRQTPENPDPLDAVEERVLHPMCKLDYAGREQLLDPELYDDARYLLTRLRAAEQVIAVAMAFSLALNDGPGVLLELKNRQAAAFRAWMASKQGLAEEPDAG